MKKIIAGIAMFAPLSAFAATPIVDINSLSTRLTNIGNILIELLISLAVIWIIWSVVRYILAADQPDKRKELGKAILYGIVGLFVILSIWGLVNILSNTFSTNTAAPVNQYPTISYPSQSNY
jgi:bacteriorhodopsin